MDATPYDIGRYWISSESGNEPYLVDVLPGGGCDCDDYRIRVEARKEKLTCKHLAFALQQFERDFPPDARAEIIRQQKKPKRSPFAVSESE